jgi:hypothetical protein
LFAARPWAPAVWTVLPDIAAIWIPGNGSALATSTEVVPDSALTVNFSELGDVTLKNHAPANAKAIAEIYEFIGVQTTRDLEVVQNMWIDFMNSFTPYHDIV